MIPKYLIASLFVLFCFSACEEYTPLEIIPLDETSSEPFLVSSNAEYIGLAYDNTGTTIVGKRYQLKGELDPRINVFATQYGVLTGVVPSRLLGTFEVDHTTNRLKNCNFRILNTENSSNVQAYIHFVDHYGNVTKSSPSFTIEIP